MPKGYKQGGIESYELTATNASSANVALEMLGENTAIGREKMAASLGLAEADLEKISCGCGDELAFHSSLATKPNPEMESFSPSTLNKSFMSDMLKRHI